LAAVKDTQLHYADNKYTNDWYTKVAKLVVENGGCSNLLQGKNVPEIENYANGTIPMGSFKKDFRSEVRKNRQTANVNGMFSDFDATDNIFIPLPLLPVKLNSAVSLVSEQGLDVSMKAVDETAQQQRKRDLLHLKERPEKQAIIQEMADMLSQGKVDLEGTSHSEVEYKEPPFGLDLNDPSQMKIMQMIYKLQAEAAYEYAIDKIYSLRRLDAVSELEARDQFKFGISCNNVIINGTTSVPDLQYLYPGYVFVPRSLYPDFRDTPYGYIIHQMTPIDLANNFGSDFGNVPLRVIINGLDNSTEGSYVGANNKGKKVSEGLFDSFKMEVHEVQFRTIDHFPIKKDENGNYVFSKQKESENLYKQNTVRFFWLKGTDYIFKKEILGHAYRTTGREAFSSFTWNIYKSQERSAVEHCVGENRAAQMAYIKLLYAIVKAAPNGKFIDMAFIHNAVLMLKLDDESAKNKAQELLDMAIEHNIMIGSSIGMDGDGTGQFVPVRDIVGGLKDDINGFLRVMAQASANISRFTGINDEMVGLNSNPDLLNGARKMNIAQGINSINYAFRAKKSNFSAAFNVIAWYIKDAIEAGGIKKKALEDFLGSERMGAIDFFGSIKGHTFFMDVNLGMNQQQRKELDESIFRMEEKGILSRLDRFIIDNTKNMKEASLLLATIEDKKMKEAAQMQQAQMQQQAQMNNAKQETLMNVEMVKSKGKQEQLMTQAEMTAKLMQLGSELGASDKQVDAFIKNQLQDKRIESSLEKTDRQAQHKKELVEMEKNIPLL
jgi:hypothetical protein